MKRFLLAALAVAIACPAMAERIPPNGEWPEAKQLRLQLGTVKILDESNAQEGEHALTLDGRKLFGVDDYLWSFIGTHKPDERRLLVQTFSGGTDCPAMWRVIDVTVPATPKISPEFGNCSDLAPLEITRAPDALRVALRNTDKPSKRKEDVFLYRDGTLYTVRGKSEIAIGPSRGTAREADMHPIDPALLNER